MSEAENSINASDQGSNAIYRMKGEIKIDKLEVSSHSMASLHLGLSGYISPGFEIGWVNQVTLRLYHSYILIGKITFPHGPIIPSLVTDLDIRREETRESEMHIKNMMGLKYFFEGFMPKVGHSHEPTNKMMEWPTATLEVSANGQRLIISTDLAKMLRMTAAVKSLTLSGDVLKIAIATYNYSPFTLDFDGDCRFVLEQEQRHIGYVKGELFISYDELDFVFRGKLYGEASGMATLKGDRFYSSDKKNSWLQYALRLFEVEINLDEIVINDDPDSEELESDSD